MSAAISADTPVFLTGGYVVLWYLYHFVADLIKLVLDQRSVDIDDIEWVVRLKSLLRMKRKVRKVACMMK